jgi:hypothetical protein
MFFDHAASVFNHSEIQCSLRAGKGLYSQARVDYG